MPETTVEAKTYFSTAPFMTMHVSAGTRSPIGTVGDRAGEKIVSFSPIGDHGHLTTDDPEVIAYLDKQIATGRGDILTPEVYNERTTPPEMKIRAQDTLIRQLTEKNRLLQEIADRKAANAR